MQLSAIKTLIVDDEVIARQVLREELDLIPQVQVIGEAENGKDALNQILNLQPDLVFLDLQMPLMGGFELINQLSGTKLPVIVIVTAYNQHAIQALNLGATGPEGFFERHSQCKLRLYSKLVPDAKFVRLSERDCVVGISGRQ